MVDDKLRMHALGYGSRRPQLGNLAFFRLLNASGSGIIAGSTLYRTRGDRALLRPDISGRYTAGDGRIDFFEVAYVGNRILVIYGSYRTDRKGMRLADFLVHRLRARGENVELIDAKAIGLPMLDRMLKEYAPGTAPVAMESLGA